MPIYEYHCEKCGEDFEYLVFGSDKPECSLCQSKKVTKLMSPCGFISKGAGGQTVSASAGSGCTGCAAGSCTGCGHS
jgi:putative FmdB family regulatory protein